MAGGRPRWGEPRCPRGSAAAAACAVALALVPAALSAGVPDHWWSMPLPEPMLSAVAKDIQTQLVNLDCFVGRVDGVIGPDTAEAIRTWQRANGLPVTGIVSEPLMVYLLTNKPWDLPRCPRRDARAAMPRRRRGDPAAAAQGWSWSS